MKSVGIDIKCFVLYSIRLVVISVVVNVKLFVDIIFRIVGWISDNIFRKFYNKLVKFCSDFSNVLLDSFYKV